MTPVRAVLVDLDGTLVESVRVHRSVHENLARALGLGGDAVTFESLSHLPLDQVQAVLASHAGRRVECVRDMHATELERNLDGLVAMPGATAFLRTVEGMMLKAALVTNAGRDYADLVLARTGLDHPFADRIHVVEDGGSKRDPGFYEKACERLGVAVAQTIHLDDDVGAIEASRAAGVGLSIRIGGAETLDRARRTMARRFLRDRLSLRPLPSRIVEARWASLPSKVQDAVDSAWEKGLAVNQALFDGSATVLAVLGPDEMALAEVPYRCVHAHQHGVAGALGVDGGAPIGVSGIVVHEGKALVGERRGHGQPRSVEFVPAGTFERSCWERPEELVHRELAEETGERSSASLDPLGLHWDAASNIWDAVYLIEVDAGFKSVVEGPEHVRFDWVPLGGVLGPAWTSVRPVGPLASLLAYNAALGG